MTSTKQQADMIMYRSAFFNNNIHLLIWVHIGTSKHFFNNKNTIIIVYITFYEEKQILIHLFFIVHLHYNYLNVKVHICADCVETNPEV